MAPSALLLACAPTYRWQLCVWAGLSCSALGPDQVLRYPWEEEKTSSNQFGHPCMHGSGFGAMRRPILSHLASGPKPHATRDTTQQHFTCIQSSLVLQPSPRLHPVVAVVVARSLPQIQHGRCRSFPSTRLRPCEQCTAGGANPCCGASKAFYENH